MGSKAEATHCEYETDGARDRVQCRAAWIEGGQEQASKGAGGLLRKEGHEQDAGRVIRIGTEHRRENLAGLRR